MYPFPWSFAEIPILHSAFFSVLAGWKISLKTMFFLRLHYARRASHATSIRSDEPGHINLAPPRCIDHDAQSIPRRDWKEIHLGHDQLSMGLWPPSTTGERGEKRGHSYMNVCVTNASHEISGRRSRTKPKLPRRLPLQDG